ncbi:MAG: phosphatidate cytidylyltransferase [Bacillota bacterium]|jgi:phosphatidate cytidylyltransferase|nr:phosphatidate cytidylyltransferase [Bacillota bacterium]HHU42834.1 phosphatidate cytidylyltransferase [Clostridiales bacterium]
MLKRTVTGLVMLGVFFLILYLTSFTHFVFDGFVMLVAVLAIYEMYAAMKKLGYKPSGVSFIVFSVLVYPLCYFYSFSGLFFAYLISFLVSFAFYIFDTKRAFKDFTVNMLLLVYPAALIGLIFVINKDYGLIPVLFAVSAALMSDTFAYYGGSFWGKKKIFPAISPKKTYVGSALGLLGGAVGGLVVYALFELAKYPAHIVFTFGSVTKFPYFLYIAIGVIISICSQAGDLAASKIKREVDIKDYGSLLGSHGGVMDRIDSVIFGVGVMAVIMFFFF